MFNFQALIAWTKNVCPLAPLNNTALGCDSIRIMDGCFAHKL